MIECPSHLLPREALCSRLLIVSRTKTSIPLSPLSELAKAAAVGQALLEGNIALRQKHESLLAALPLQDSSRVAGNSRVRGSPLSFGRSHARKISQRPSSWITDDGESELEASSASTADRERPGCGHASTPSAGGGESTRRYVVGMGHSSPRPSLGSGWTGSPMAASGDPGWVFGRPISRTSGMSSSSLSNPSSISSGAGVSVSSPSRSKRVSTLSISSASSPVFSAFSSHHRAHAPSITASPSAVAFLREENDALAVQYERLQAETAEADQAGRRRLRKLEKEIGVLREQLESTEGMVENLKEKNVELERRTAAETNAAMGGSAGTGQGDGGWAERRKARLEREWRERRDRLEAAARQGYPFTSPTLSSPHEQFLRSRSPSPEQRAYRHESSSCSSSQTTLSPPASPRTRSLSLLGPFLSATGTPIRRTPGITSAGAALLVLPSSSAASAGPSSASAAAPPKEQTEAELALVGQLLSKIRELELANEEMRRNRDVMDQRIEQAEREGRELEGVYEVLESEAERAGLDYEGGASVAEAASPGWSTAEIPGTSRERLSPSASGDQEKATTANKSSASPQVEASFFTFSPLKSGQSRQGRLSSHQQHLATSNSASSPLRHPSGGGRALSHQPSSGSFRMAQGNRRAIESRKLRKRISLATFESPRASLVAAQSDTSAASDDASMTPKGFADLALLTMDGSSDDDDDDIRDRSDLSPSLGRKARRSWLDEVGTAPLEPMSSLVRDSAGSDRRRKLREMSLESWAIPADTAGQQTSSRDVFLDESSSGADDEDEEEEAGISDEPHNVEVNHHLIQPPPSREAALVTSVDPLSQTLHLSLASSEDSGPASPTILLPGSLSQSKTSSQTYDLIDLLARERPIAWSEPLPSVTTATAMTIISGPTSTHALSLRSEQRALWADLLPSSLRILRRSTTTAAMDNDNDPFETTFYPEPEIDSATEDQDRVDRRTFRARRVRAAVERGEDPYTFDVLRPPTKRELAIQRLEAERGLLDGAMVSQGRGADVSEDDEDDEYLLVQSIGRDGKRLRSAPSDGPSDWLIRLRPGWVVDRLGRRVVQGFGELFFLCQIL